MEHVVIVGAGLGGVRTAEQLRSGGHRGPITLIGAEEHPPYDRPPLSKQILSGAWDAERVILRDKPALDELDITYRLGSAAVSLNGTTVGLDDGTSVAGDAVVIATGVTARAIPGQPGAVWSLRTLDDALALRDALDNSRSLLVVGGGFIGAEVAHAARARGLDVTVLEAMPGPCERALGREGGALAGRLFTESGADLRCGSRISRFVDAHTVELADGSTLSADIVLVGIGATPELSWLAGSGLDVGDGVACDRTGRAVGAAGVWALGDVAAWWDDVRGGRCRTEHWTTTVDQAAIVARDILGLELPAPSVPYVWSDQFGLKIQLVGRPDLADNVLQVIGDGLDGGPVRGTVIGYFAGDRLVAVAGFGAPRHLPRLRGLVATGAHRGTVLSLAQELIGGVVR
ncbi:NAD(P)/FAD-dependent oxidoreductase [Cryptosporangium phraense]|uniref:FAD-dependent oxidoreductase n=1 Tax=Cryptosporangium phraense TaxID=2593070 RepID=A0A545B087_9ACTN|nr:FAD-dependent oxidoreductase [Cryptosporangium phraense]TQS46979.1 FAD-dependent oxidoreductase [Cryptosporangium phraense]